MLTGAAQNVSDAELGHFQFSGENKVDDDIVVLATKEMELQPLSTS